MRFATASSLLICFLSAGQIVFADETDELSKKVFTAFETDLIAVEKSPGAAHAKAEILIAREWIEEGRTNQPKGQEKKAALVAERPPSQLELVKTLATAGAVLERVSEADAEIQAYTDELKLLKARLDRLLLVYRGRSSTVAFPPKSQETQQ